MWQEYIEPEDGATLRVRTHVAVVAAFRLDRGREERRIGACRQSGHAPARGVDAPQMLESAFAWHGGGDDSVQVPGEHLDAIRVSP